MPSQDPDSYELALLKRGPRNAAAVMTGGAVMLVGSMGILLLTGGGLFFYGAVLASFSVMGKGWNDLRLAKRAIRMHRLDKADGTL
jgi:hypothetical protein